jgi:hypothetical protein
MVRIASSDNPSGYSGMIAVPSAGPLGSFIVPVESAVSVRVIMVLVESSVADEN